MERKHSTHLTKVNKRGIWLCVTAVFVVAFVIGMSALRDDWMSFALYRAIDRGDVKAVEELLNAGVSIETECRSGSGSSFLEFAEYRRNWRIARGYTPLIDATFFSKWKIAEILINRGANVNASDGAGSTPLLWASGNGDSKTVALLLAKGANPNAAYKDGSTPLSETKLPEIAKLLVDAGGKM